MNPGPCSDRLCWQLALAGAMSFWVTLLVGLWACSAPALPPGYKEAELLERSGRYEAARDRYSEAARRCRKAPLECAVTESRVAQMELRLGNRSAAIEAFMRVARGSGRGLPVGARSLVRAATLLAEDGQWARAERLFFEVIDRYPQAIAADEALRRLVRRYRATGRAKALVSELRKRYGRLKRQDIADNLIFEAARILEDDPERRDLAVALYLKIPRDHPQSGLCDDALWRAAAVRRKQRRFMDAILIYKKILATREDAYGGASYHSEYLDDAHLEIGRTWLLDLRRPGKAISAFRRLVDGLPTSVLRDDAQFWTVLAEVERGRPGRARRAFEDLRERFPRSRFAKEAPVLAAWMTFRQAARGGDTQTACRAWREIREAHRFSWLVRHGPRPKPWPRCGEGGEMCPGEGDVMGGLPGEGTAARGAVRAGRVAGRTGGGP